jgi:REP element-mobilizing transposase RayT
MDKFQNKYRIPSARAQWWNYGNNAAYFVTICTQDRIHYFGKIATEPQLIASELGQLAEKYWYEIPNQFPFVKLGAFVVMPNHIHGIVIIDKQDESDESGVLDLSDDIQTRLIVSQQQQQQTGGITGNFNPMLNENLPRIIRWYKGRCAFEMRKIKPGFKWQSRYHEHIIRNGEEYQRINDYIENNPLNWPNDKFSKSETK